MKRLTTEDWINKAKEVHKDVYDYTETLYTNARTPLKIKCRIHGSFMQTPSSHTNGSGCKKCGIEVMSESQKMTLEDFIARANKIHSGKYKYNLVEYKNSASPIKIVCPVHGIFKQVVNNHLAQKQGCPKCSLRRGWSKEEFIRMTPVATLYVIKCFNSEELFIKIGITSKDDLKNRFRNKKEMPYNYKILKEIKGSSSYIFDLEKHLHNNLVNFSYKPDIDFRGKTECFEFNISIINRIEKYKEEII